jgi:hypothetical protein
MPAALALAGDAPRPDPLPLKRVHIAPDKVSAELAQKGILLLLPRADFEAQVQQAALAVEQVNNPPRLVKTLYTARLVDQALVGGAEWFVQHTVPGPGLVPLGDFNLALGKRLKVDGADGLLGDLDGKTPSLWIDKPGPATVYFDWSRRGVPAGDGLHFDLDLPACANAHLELTLPSDHVVSVGKPGVLISGPLDTADAALRTWKLSFAGRSHLEFVVRRLDSAGPGGPVLLMTLQARQELGPERVLADFDCQVEVPQGSVSQLVFTLDAPLQPYEVSLGGVELKNWKWWPPVPAQPTHGQLLVSLKEPMQGPLPVLRVRCLAPLQKNKKNITWVSPAVHLVGAVSRGETLRLQVLPEAHLENWKPGHFRLANAMTEADGTQVLTLTHGGAAPPRPPAGLPAGGPTLAYSAALGVQAPPLQRPSAVVRARTCEFLARQQTWWQIDQHHSTLTTELECRPMHGQLFHLPLKLPPDGQVEQLTVEPKAMLRGWVPAGTRQSPLVLIDLAQPATLQTPVTIKLRVRLPQTTSGDKAPVLLPFAEVEPFDSCLREGALAISIHPRWQAALANVSNAAGEVPPDGPWQAALTDYFFTFHGKPLTGLLRLTPRAPQVQARCQSDVLLGGSRGTLVTRLTLEPSGGSVDHVDVLVSAALAETWRVRSEGPMPRIAGVQRLTHFDATAGLLALGSRHGLEALTMLATQPGTQLWRIRFVEPVSSRIHLVLVSSFAPGQPWASAGPNGQCAWSIPVVSVLGAEAFPGADHLLAVQVLGAEIVSATADSLQELPHPGGGPGKASATLHGLQQLWRVYRYDGPRPRLVVQARAVAVDVTVRETCDAAWLTTYVEPSGHMVHHFKFQMRSWRKRELPVLLPPGAQVVRASTEGRSLTAFSQKEHPEGVQVDLPASTALAVQHFEIEYRTADGLAPCAPWKSLPAALPQLPVKPLELRRTWVLPPDVVPLDGSLVRLVHRPDEPASNGHALSLQPLWEAGQPLLASFLEDTPAPSWAVVQRQHLSVAETALRQLGGTARGWSLGQAVEWLALDQWKHQLPLIVDAAALSIAGLTPETPFAAGGTPAGAWARLELIFVPTPCGMLLTTRQQWLFWGGQEATSVVMPGTLADAIADASQRGHDSSGRFWSATTWLQHRVPLSLAGVLPELALLGPRFTPEDLDSRWTQWEAPAGLDAPPTLLVVRTLTGHVAGLGLALVFGLVAWCLRKQWAARWRARLLLAWLALAVLAAVWLPLPLRPAALWPAAAAAAVVVVWYVRSLRGQSAPVPAPPSSEVPRAVAPAAVGAGLGLLLIGWAVLPSVWAQVPDAKAADPNTVLVLAGTPEAPERQSVLVSPELLKKLEALVQRSPAHLHGATLVSASYEGAASGELALFKAEFQLHSFEDKAALTIPLGGVELREGALLDGAPIQPTANAAGYVVTVKGKGAHQLTLLFSVRLQSTPEHQDLRFTIPRLHQSRLQLQTPPGKPQWQVLSGMGQSSTDAQTGRVAVELGRDGTLHLRCPLPGAGPAAKVAVREAYFWDLRAPDSECTGVLQYQVSGGSTAHLVVALPDTLEARAVEVAGEGDGGEEAGRPRLKNWYVAAEKGQWRLHVWLQAPVSGQVQLTLRLLPRQPATPGPLRLRLPLPLEAQLTGGIVGYRIDHPNPIDNRVSFQGVFLQPALFAKQWPGPTGVTPTRAYSFGGHTADSTVVVTLPPARPSIEQDLHWTIFADHGEIAATLKATATGDDLVLIEWDVPASVTVAEITGDNVRSWARVAPTDARIQVWLKQPAKTATLRLHGWTAYPKLQSGPPVRWIVPVLRCPDGVNARTTLQMSESPPAAYAGTDTKKFLNLTALPQTASTWVCLVPTGLYRAEFLVRAVAPPPQVLGLTNVEVRDGLVQLTTFLHIHVNHAGAASFSVRVSRWQGALLKLDGPGEVVLRWRKRRWDEQHWQVTMPAAAPRRLILKLAGSLPATAGLHFDLPRIDLQGANWADHWVAASTPGLHAQAAQGLTAVKVGGAVPEVVAERFGKPAALWKADRDDWRLSLSVVAAPAVPGVEVLHAEQQAVFADNFGWVHQAELMLYVKESYDVTVQMPAGALLLTAAIDGEIATPRFVGPDRIALTLPPGEGVRHLGLRWVFGRQNEDPGQPKLQAPRLEGLPATPISWTVLLPVGYRLQDPTVASEVTPTLAAARQHVARAEALAAASQRLAEHWSKWPEEGVKAQLLTCQKQLFRHCRLAGLLLDSPTDAQDAAEHDRLRHQVTRLLKYNAAALRKSGLDKVRAQLEKSVSVIDHEADVFTLPVRGTVLRLQTEASGPPPAPTLTTTAQDVHDQALAQTRAVMIVFVVLLGLTWVPRLTGIVRRFWPEQVAAVAVIGWYFGGFSPLALLLLVVAASGRGWLLGDWLRRRTKPLAT